MIHLSNFLKRPFIIPELMLALYLVIFIVLFGPVFSPIAKLIGYASAGVFFLELFFRGKVTDFIQCVAKVWPYAMFYIVMSLVVFPLLPYKGALINSFTNFIAFIIVFYLVRQYRILHGIDFAFLVIVIGIGSLFFVFPSLIGLDAASQTRIKMQAEALGTGSKGSGLNASNISLYFGLASFVALRCLTMSRDVSQHFLTVAPRSWKTWASVACIGLALFTIVVSSGSRQGLVWVVFIVISAMAIRFRRNFFIGLVISGFVGVFFLLIVFTFFRDTELVQRILILFDPRMMAIDPEKSLLTRLEMYKEGYRMWLKRPLWGNGNEAFRAFSAWQGHYSHSNFIEILVNYGLLGFMFFFGPIFFLIGNATVMFTKGRPEYRTVLLWLIFACLALLASSLFIPSFYRKLMVVFLGYMFGIYHNVKDDFRATLGGPAMR